MMVMAFGIEGFNHGSESMHVFITGSKWIYASTLLSVQLFIYPYSTLLQKDFMKIYTYIHTHHQHIKELSQKESKVRRKIVRLVWVGLVQRTSYIIKAQ